MQHSIHLWGGRAHKPPIVWQDVLSLEISTVINVKHTYIYLSLLHVVINLQREDSQILPPAHLDW